MGTGLGFGKGDGESSPLGLVCFVSTPAPGLERISGLCHPRGVSVGLGLLWLLGAQNYFASGDPHHGIVLC